MALSPELRRLKEAEPDYVPSDTVRHKLADKVLIPIIGPTAIGKSTVIDEIVKLSNAHSWVHPSVTRRRRSDDPPSYTTADEGFTLERAIKLVKNLDLVNYAIHPSGNIYSTTSESYQAKYNFLPMMSSSLRPIQKAGFAAVKPFYMVAEEEAYAQQLTARMSDPSFTDRLTEGIDSLEWALKHHEEISFVENISGQPKQTAQQVILALESPQPAEEKIKGLKQAEAMLGMLKSMKEGARP